jgi:hypothetical protein
MGCSQLERTVGFPKNQIAPCRENPGAAVRCAWCLATRPHPLAVLKMMNPVLRLGFIRYGVSCGGEHLLTPYHRARPRATRGQMSGEARCDQLAMLPRQANCSLGPSPRPCRSARRGGGLVQSRFGGDLELAPMPWRRLLLRHQGSTMRGQRAPEMPAKQPSGWLVQQMSCVPPN